MKIRRILFLLLAVSSNTFSATSDEDYAYFVRVMPPFNTVLINNTITCPIPGSRSPFCLVEHQVIGAMMTIQGVRDHVCYLKIEPNGAVKVDEARSIFCTIQSKPATHSSTGQIVLQSHF